MMIVWTNMRESSLCEMWVEVKLLSNEPSLQCLFIVTICSVLKNGQTRSGSINVHSIALVKIVLICHMKWRNTVYHYKLEYYKHRSRILQNTPCIFLLSSDPRVGMHGSERSKYCTKKYSIPEYIMWWFCRPAQKSRWKPMFRTSFYRCQNRCLEHRFLE